MSLDYIPTILPPKKYYMPQHETLLTYDTSNGQSMEAIVEVEELVLFGVHTCDLAGTQCLNVSFPTGRATSTTDPEDPFYPDRHRVHRLL